MTDLRQVAMQALEALENEPRYTHIVEAIAALRAALKQPEQEPAHGDIRALKYLIHELEGEVIGYKRMLEEAGTAGQPEQEPTCPECKAAVLFECVACSNNNYPPKAQRPWVGLTEGERNDLEDYCKMTIGKFAFDAIEAKLKEKNAT